VKVLLLNNNNEKNMNKTTRTFFAPQLYIKAGIIDIG
jgi:hypothetical protein